MEDEFDDFAPPQSALSPVTIAALIGGIGPFCLSYTSSSSTTINGVTTSSYIDYIAVVGGPLAILCGLIGLITGLKASNKLMGLGLPLLAMVLGVYQLLRGFGML